MLESWKHCVASGGTEAAAARTVIMEKNSNKLRTRYARLQSK